MFKISILKYKSVAFLFVVSFCFFGLGAPHASAAKGPYTTYYVCNTAQGDGTGISEGNCMASATHNAKATDYFAGGDTILLSNTTGTIPTLTPKSSGASASSMITYMNVLGEDVILDSGTTVRAFIIQSVSYIHLTKNTTGSITAKGVNGAVFIYRPSGTAAGNVVDYINIVEGFGYVWGATGTTWNYTNITNSGTVPYGLIIQGGTEISASHNTITTTGTANGIECLNCTSGIVNLSYNNVTLHNAASRFALYVTGSVFTSFTSSHNSWRNGHASMEIVDSANMTFSYDDTSLATYGGMEILGNSYNVTFDHVTSHDNLYDGFDVSAPNDTGTPHDITFQYCTATNNGTTGASADGDGFSAHNNAYNITYKYNEGYNNKNTCFAHVGHSHGWMYNNTCYNNGNSGYSIRGGLYLVLDGVNPTAASSWTAKNNIISQSYNYGVFLNATSTGLLGTTLNLDYNNYFPLADNHFASLNEGSTVISWTTYHASYDTHSYNTNPLFLSSSDFHLLSSSSAIDVGTDVSLTTDYAGNPIYGAPDIGAYEYQPPYTLTTTIPTTGSVRLYSNGKYRALTATSTSATGTFSVTPVGGSFYTASTSAYMDITVSNWTTANKEWIATSTSGQFNTHATSTVYTLGDLTPSAYYSFKIDGSASTAITDNSQCTAGICLSDGSGNLSFTYTGGYSTHTFDLVALPIVTTQVASSLAQTTATLNSNITSTGGASVTVRGFAYGTDATLATVIATTTDTVGQPFSTGAYTSDISSLTCNTTYYFRPYATNSAGDGLGTIETFTTTACSHGGGGASSTVYPPLLSTEPATSVTATTTILNGSIDSANGAYATVRGFTYGTSTTLTTVIATTTEQGSFNASTFTSAISNLSCATSYYFRSYATNSAGTGLGAIKSFITSDCPASIPVSSTTPAVPATPTAANPSGLSETQVQSIISLLVSFGLDQTMIDNVTASLRGTSSNISTAIQTAVSFIRDLQLHDTGADIKALQQFLNTHGFIIAQSGAGSLGHETTTFGLATYRALVQFQKSKSITPASGYLGPKTRAAINSGN